MDGDSKVWILSHVMMQFYLEALDLTMMMMVVLLVVVVAVGDNDKSIWQLWQAFIEHSLFAQFSARYGSTCLSSQ